MSRFVSAGSDGELTTEHDEAWSKAQQQIEATKQQKVIAGQQEGDKSLYETLQANKAAKQEAFEDATRLRTQFRSLDEDEVDFLDSVLESSRSKEAEVKKETREQLEAFRKQQEEAEKSALQDETLETPVPTETWSVASRKRKKGREKEGIGGVKVRRISTADGKAGIDGSPGPAPADSTKAPTKGSKGNGQATRLSEESKKEGEMVIPGTVASQNAAKLSSPVSTALGLGAYSSDEDG